MKVLQTTTTTTTTKPTTAARKRKSVHYYSSSLVSGRIASSIAVGEGEERVATNPGQEIGIVQGWVELECQ